MKSENSLGVLFGLLSWVIMFGVLLSVVRSNPPTPTPTTSIQNQKGKGRPEVQESNSENAVPGGLSASIDKLASEMAERNQQERAKNSEEDSSYHWWAVNGTNVVIAIFTIVLAVVGFLQRITYENGLKTSKAQLRAYLSIEIDNDERVFPEQKVPAIFNCVNHGVSPAKKVIWRAQAVDLSEGTRFPEMNARWEGAYRTIFPTKNTEDAPRVWYFTSSIFSDGTINQSFLSKRRFALGIEIKYVDIFGEEQITRECFYIPSHRDGRPMERIPGESFIS